MRDEILEEFVSKEPKRFAFKIGHHLASSLSGFIAGAIFASVVWVVAIYIYRLLSN